MVRHVPASQWKRSVRSSVLSHVRRGAEGGQIRQLIRDSFGSDRVVYVYALAFLASVEGFEAMDHG